MVLMVLVVVMVLTSDTAGTSDAVGFSDIAGTIDITGTSNITGTAGISIHTCIVTFVQLLYLLYFDVCIYYSVIMEESDDGDDTKDKSEGMYEQCMIYLVLPYINRILLAYVCTYICTYVHIHICSI